MPPDVQHILFAAEAMASCALDRDENGDGMTKAVGRFVPERETPGYGCPHCGSVLRLDATYVIKNLIRSGCLPCCGYAPGDLELSRWLRAARLLHDAGPRKVA